MLMIRALSKNSQKKEKQKTQMEKDFKSLSIKLLTEKI